MPPRKLAKQVVKVKISSQKGTRKAGKAKLQPGTPHHGEEDVSDEDCSRDSIIFHGKKTTNKGRSLSKSKSQPGRVDPHESNSNEDEDDSDVSAQPKSQSKPKKGEKSKSEATKEHAASHEPDNESTPPPRKNPKKVMRM